MSPELIAAIGRLVREMPRNPFVIAVDEALKADIAMVTPLVTLVTKVVTPKRDRAKYMRDRRAAQNSSKNNQSHGRPSTP
jgi:hypothetical protein